MVVVVGVVVKGARATVRRALSPEPRGVCREGEHRGHIINMATSFRKAPTIQVTERLKRRRGSYLSVVFRAASL